MVIIFLCLVGFVGFVTAQTCDDHDECKGQTINSGHLYCYGDTACEDADITSTNGHVYCYGNYGCRGADITTVTYDVYCYGNYACYDAAITAKRHLHCSGLHSCREAQISSAEAIYAYGFYGLYNARIDTDDAQTTALTVSAGGYRSAYGADIICRTGKTCTLNCLNDGCENLDFVCLSGATCHLTPSGCTADNDGATVGRVICPSFAQSTTPFMDTDLLRKLEEKRIIKNKQKPDDLEEPQEPDDYDDNNNRYYIPNEPEEHDNKYYIKFDTDNYGLSFFFIVGLVLILTVLLVYNIWNCLKEKKNRYDLVSYKSDAQ